MTREAVLREALKLRRAERAEVAAELLASLDDGPEVDDPVPPADWRAWRGVLAGTGALEEHLREHREETAGLPPQGEDSSTG